jgi:hypothetical protein
MFKTPELTLCAYDAMMWRYGRLKKELNFLDVQSWHEAELSAP